MTDSKIEKVNTNVNEVVLQVKNMTKIFGTVTALSNVDISLDKGEVLGLIGENGSGKSTLTSIIAGMQKANEGTMLFVEQEWKPSSMIDALSKGVGMIVQESGTIAGITVAENIFLAETDKFRMFVTKSGKRWGLINNRAMNRAADKVLDDIGAKSVRGSMLMGALDFQTRKLVEIAKVHMKKPQVLVVDETTTALSQYGRELLYNLIKSMKAENKSVIFISHDLEELVEVCDSLTVLRDGKYICNFTKDQFDLDTIRTSLIGREMEGEYYRSDFEASFEDDIVLEANNITQEKQLVNVSLKLHKGEILGIGGLSHCGMHTLGKVLFGAEKPKVGQVTVNKKVIKNEAVAMKMGIGYVAKDRDTESLALNASIKDNIAIGGLNKFSISNFLVLYNKENAYVNRQVGRLQIKCSGTGQDVSQLSGGNKQKVVFGKWVGRDSDILILDCPTRGVDIGVKQQMYRLMTRLKQSGKSIIMISEEMTELMGMSDRILIMKDGEITKEFLRSKELSDAEIIKYMI